MGTGRGDCRHDEPHADRASEPLHRIWPDLAGSPERTNRPLCFGGIRFRNQSVVDCVADGNVLDQWDTGYDRIPYFPYFGLSSASWAPEYEAQSVVGDMVESVQEYDYLMSLWIQWAIFAALPMGVVEVPPGPPLVDAQGKALTTLEYAENVTRAPAWTTARTR